MLMWTHSTTMAKSMELQETSIMTLQESFAGLSTAVDLTMRDWETERKSFKTPFIIKRCFTNSIYMDGEKGFAK